MTLLSSSGGGSRATQVSMHRNLARYKQEQTFLTGLWCRRTRCAERAVLAARLAHSRNPPPPLPDTTPPPVFFHCCPSCLFLLALSSFFASVISCLPGHARVRMCSSSCAAERRLSWYPHPLLMCNVRPFHTTKVGGARLRRLGGKWRPTSVVQSSHVCLYLLIAVSLLLVRAIGMVEGGGRCGIGSRACDDSPVLIRRSGCVNESSSYVRREVLEAKGSAILVQFGPPSLFFTS